MVHVSRRRGEDFKLKVYLPHGVDFSEDGKGASDFMHGAPNSGDPSAISVDVSVAAAAAVPTTIVTAVKMDSTTSTTQSTGTSSTQEHTTTTSSSPANADGTTTSGAAATLTTNGDSSDKRPAVSTRTDKNIDITNKNMDKITRVIISDTKNTNIIEEEKEKEENARSASKSNGLESHDGNPTKLAWVQRQLGAGSTLELRRISWDMLLYLSRQARTTRRGGGVSRCRQRRTEEAFRERRGRGGGAGDQNGVPAGRPQKLEVERADSSVAGQLKGLFATESAAGGLDAADARAQGSLAKDRVFLLLRTPSTQEQRLPPSPKKKEEEEKKKKAEEERRRTSELCRRRLVIRWTNGRKRTNDQHCRC